jgi:hypothetical protein
MSWAAVAGAGVGLVGSLIKGGQGTQPKTVQGNTQQFVDPTQYAANLNHVNQGLSNQQNLVNNLQAQNGLANQSQVFNQLGNVAAGQGPNPAQAMLANATGANTANQAALMAGQRGVGQNAGLLARQAAQQGSMNQQTMAGQAAAMQAQQSLAALGQQGNIAGQQANQLLQGNQMYTNAGLQGQKNLLDAQNAQNDAAIKNAQMANTNNQVNAGRQAQLEGNLAGAAGSALTGPLGDQITGGIKSLFGGSTPKQQPAGQPGSMLGTSTNLGDMTPNVGGAMDGFNPGASDAANADSSNYDMTTSGGLGPLAEAKGGMIPSPRSRVGMMFAGGGKVPHKVPALVSPGERYLPPKAVKEVAKGKDPMKAGEKIPGKAKVKGDKNSYANDTVPKTLEEGGIVLPRSVTQAKHPHWAAHQFVANIMKEQALKKGK